MSDDQPVMQDEQAQGGKLEAGTALCLSGGGYRATLFHIGAVLRLNELGLLADLQRISSVSGGSITAAVLGLNWTRLGWKPDAQGVRRADPALLKSLFIDPLRKMAATSIDASSIFWGTVNPWTWISEEVAKQYDEVLFHGKTLQDLPDDEKNEGPRFVLNATNVMTGSLFRFSRPYLGDWRLGQSLKPRVPLAQAVAASSAFPPFLSPMRLSLKGLNFIEGDAQGADLNALRQEALLTDGGVYDNLGLETVWKKYKTVFVSDAGRKMDDDLTPGSDWATHSKRLIDLLQHQVSNLRRRMCVGEFADPRPAEDKHEGVYWGIQSNFDDPKDGKPNRHVAHRLEAPSEMTNTIARVATRLTALDAGTQERIINWGYACSDTCIRSFYAPMKTAPAATAFPYPKTALG